MIKQLVKDILNFNEFMTEEERDNYIATVAAFGAMVLASSNPKRKVNEIVVGEAFDDNPASAEAMTMGDHGFQIGKSFFKKTSNLCSNLSSVYHESSHIFNDPHQIGINPTMFDKIIQGEIIHVSAEEYAWCMKYIHEYSTEDGELLLDKLPEGVSERIEQFLARPQYVKGTIFRAYWNQPHERRAREWGNAILDELIRLAEDEQELGNLSTLEEVNLFCIKTQLAQLKKDDLKYSKNLDPPTQEDLDKLKEQLLETRALYYDQLDDYLDSSPVNKLVVNLCRKTPNPVKYLSNSLMAFYDDNLAHELFNKCLINIDRDYDLISTIIEIYTCTPMIFTDIERKAFNAVVTNPIYVQSDIDDVVGSIEEVKQHNEAGRNKYNVLDPLCAEGIFSADLSNMPQRKISEFLDKEL